MLKEKINDILKEIEGFSIDSKEQLENYRIKYLSRKGILNDLFEDFKKTSPDIKRELGQTLNNLKNKTQQRWEELKDKFENAGSSTPAQNIDFTLPGESMPLGATHPITKIKNEIIDIFSRIGFTVSEGREIEDDWHNFTALNTPEYHPARDMQDTFYIDTNPTVVLRTQTSSVQVHLMENQKPPIRTISPGRVYRNEAISARSHCQFHQVEGLYIDKEVSLADLKQTLNYFAVEMFGASTKIRLRPSYFPFTEPSAEMDVSCPFCKSKGCNICKGSGWVEILGCGMVDPAVLDNCKIDSNIYSGYAFGMGVERITMLKYQVKDIRLFFENDIRFLNQFKSIV